MHSRKETKVYPQCEKCWIQENSRWEPDGVSQDGKLVTRLTGIMVPYSMTTGKVNVCCICGELTVVGIYVEKEEDEVMFDSEPLNISPED